MIIITSSCSVNQFAGLIKIVNTTGNTFESVEIGNVTGTFFLQPNSSADCWFYKNFEGDISFQEYMGNSYTSSSSFDFNVNESYTVTIKNTNGKYFLNLN